MPTTVSLHQLKDLAVAESKNEIFVNTTVHTELYIRITAEGTTIISFPYGNKFDIIDGKIIIHEKL